MARFNLSSPWVEIYEELTAMFKHDEEVRVVYFDGDGADHKVDLYVSNAEKAEALFKVIKPKHTFGNVVLYVNVIMPNGQVCDTTEPVEGDDDYADIYEKAFAGNGAFVHTVKVDGVMFMSGLVYVVFRPTVVQYFNDDLGDVNGHRSCLYQDLAKELFITQPGVFFCTDRYIEVYPITTPKWP
jgi:hypothetical protein